MTVTVTPVPVTSPPDKFGGDPVAFDAAMQAHLDWQVAAIPQMNAQNAENNAINAAVSATAVAAQADRVICQAAAAAIAQESPTANAAAAAIAAAQAQAYASQAQATNPDSPIRLNPRRIAVNFTVPTGYNAASTGPITVADGVAVTVATGAAWSVH